MSVSSFTYCVTCSEKAKELGDGGMMGSPEIKAKKTHNKDWGVTTYSFGWIYDGLKSISLLPAEVEAYRQFLEKHAGHEMFLGNDHMELSEVPQMDEDNITAFEPDLEGFVAGTIEVSCEASGERICTTWDGERYRPFEPRQLSDDELKNFLKRLTAPEVLDSIDRTSPSVDPYGDLGEIVQFIQSHQDNAITVRLLPKD